MKKILKLIPVFLVLMLLVAAAYLLRSSGAIRTIEQLLTENAALKSAVSNLTNESQIGYAKVLSQEHRDGVLFTRLLFVQTDPHDLTQHLISEEFEIEGNIAHFDTLMIKFDSRLVMDGKERTMYLWRRVYGEKMRPEDGFGIDLAGQPSRRYRNFCDKLSVSDSRLFWQEIWDLANNPKKLEHLGVQAVYGNVVYGQMRPGLIYIFKVSDSGALYPQVVPAL